MQTESEGRDGYVACQIDSLLSAAGKKVCLKRTAEYYKAEKLIKG